MNKEIIASLQKAYTLLMEEAETADTIHGSMVADALDHIGAAIRALGYEPKEATK